MPQSSEAADPHPLGKLRWRCRRGMKELDLLLARYVDEQYPQADAGLQRAFRELLELQDPLIHAYLLGRESPPTPSFLTLIERITGGSANDR